MSQKDLTTSKLITCDTENSSKSTSSTDNDIILETQTVNDGIIQFKTSQNRAVRQRKPVERLGFSGNPSNADEHYDSENDFLCDASSEEWHPNEEDLFDDDEELGRVDEENTAKRRKPNESSRLNIPAERIGTTEALTSDDVLFDHADKERQETLIEVQTGETVVSHREESNDRNIECALLETMSPGEKIIFKRLLDMAADIKVLRTQILEISAPKNGNGRPNKAIDRDELMEIGLPLVDKTTMDKFEENLFEKCFKNKAVCVDCIQLFLVFDICSL